MNNQTAEDRLAGVATLLMRGLENLQRLPPIQRKLLIEREQLFNPNAERKIASVAGESGDTDLLQT
ncbi:MAG: hypothetical protein HY674_23510 [Chloroflexi bacterium]|nr:hypothetical protein [Chloroflexota bacterium]